MKRRVGGKRVGLWEEGLAKLRLKLRVVGNGESRTVTLTMSRLTTCHSESQWGHKIETNRICPIDRKKPGKIFSQKKVLRRELMGFEFERSHS